MKKKILYILAPNDRFNYGDLLFPYIIKHFFFNIVDEIKFCSTKKSDLSKLGGIPTESIENLIYASPQNENYLIVAGGDSLFIDWNTILSFIDKKINLLSIFDYKFKTTLLKRYIKKHYKTFSKYPFSIGKNELKNFKGVYYNSLGGTTLELNPSLLNNKENIAILNSIDYISVRERKTSEILEENGIPNCLVPDSAILMSDVFNDNFLRAQVSKQVSEISNKKYLFFQIGKSFLKNDEKFFSYILDNISEKYNIDICLCPIGTAMGHCDYEALYSIMSLIKNRKTHLIKQPNIWEIMWLIKNSKLYFGSSLHGTITSMSYDIPFVAYGPIKLKNYIETWAKECINQFVSIENVQQKIEEQIINPIICTKNIQKQKVLDSLSIIQKMLLT